MAISDRVPFLRRIQGEGRERNDTCVKGFFRGLMFSSDAFFCSAASRPMEPLHAVSRTAIKPGVSFPGCTRVLFSMAPLF